MSALFSLPTVSLDTGLLSVTDTNCGVGDRCRVLFIGAVVLPSTGNWTLGWEAGANGRRTHPSTHRLTCSESAARRSTSSGYNMSDLLHGEGGGNSFAVTDRGAAS